MKFETYLLMALLVFGVWRTNRSVQRSQSAQERQFAMRTSIFSWFVGFIMLAALLLLPFRVGVLLLIPIVFIGLSVTRFLRDARARLRREAQDRVDFDRMKRVQPIR